MRTAVVSANQSSMDALCAALTDRLGFKIAWTSLDADCAAELFDLDSPDLMVVDVSSRSIDGLRLIQRSSAGRPVLAVVDADQDFSSQIYDALGRGAVDAAKIPQFDESGSLIGERDFLDKVATIARLRGESLDRRNRRSAPPISTKPPILVAFGSSTGGPQSLARILSAMPRSLPAAYVIVQHLDERFAADMAAWLEPLTSLEVRVAEPGAAPLQGTVWVANPNAHVMARADGTLGYEQDRGQSPYRPCIDRYFQSLALHHVRPGVAVLLSGMGRDGAEGLLTLRNAGWRTIAQDESTSAVYGMPRAAVELHAAERVLPDSQIARAVEAAVWSLL